MDKTDKRPLRLIGPAVLLLLIIILAACPSYATEIDTTAQKEPERPEKSTGEAVLDGFSEILKLPTYPVKGLAYGVVWTVWESPLHDILFAPAPLQAVYPVASYGSNPGLKGGLGYYYKDLISAGDVFKLKGYYSTHKYQRYGFEYDSPRLFSSQLGLYLGTSYYRRPWESFYGLGNGSHECDEISYTREETRITGNLIWQLGKNASVEVGGEVLVVNLYDGENDERPSGLDSIATMLELTDEQRANARVWTSRIRLTHDKRDHPGQTLSGERHRLTASYSRGTGETDDLEFYQINYDFEQYLELFNRRVLVLKGSAQRVDRDETAPSLPFYMRSGLGGKDGLMGYRSKRFVDHDLMLVMLEYRYPMWERLDAFLCYEQGRVFESIIDDFEFRHWKYSAAVGVRIWGEEGEVGRLTVAASKEAVRFYLQFGADW